MAQAGNNPHRMSAKMSQEDFLELMKIVDRIRRANEQNDVEELKNLSRYKEILMMLLEYLILNEDNLSVDPEIIKILLKFLGLDRKKAREMDELEEEREEELDEEQKKNVLRFIIYEIYKILNPHRIAGETALENFVNNVRTRGVKVAMREEGHEYARKFNSRDLENLESHRFGFVASLEKAGFKGGGRGL
jgi:transcriptional regulator with XRE-family HTH domain